MGSTPPPGWNYSQHLHLSLSTDGHILHFSHSIFSNSEVTSHPEKPNFSNKDCSGGVANDDGTAAKNKTERFGLFLVTQRLSFDLISNGQLLKKKEKKEMVIIRRS